MNGRGRAAGADTIPTLRAADEDIPLAIERPRPLLTPGLYEAVCASIRRGRLGARTYLEAGFTIFDGPITDGVVLARDLPGFFRLPPSGRRLGRSSKLARWLSLLGPETRLDRIPTRTLREHYWRVRVATVTTDSRQHDLPVPNRYSKVEDVVERLA